MFKRLLIWTVWLFEGTMLMGQFEPTPFFQFRQDSAMIGEEIEALLTFEHPFEYELLFPDSSYGDHYAPFEYVRKKVFPTATKDSVSTDSVIYILQTFELDKVQTLKLNVLLLTTKDTLTLTSNVDTIFLKEVVNTLPDTLKLIENSKVVQVDKEFNYPYVLIGIGILGILFLIVGIVFGGKIRNGVTIFFWNRKHRKFMINMEGVIGEYQGQEQNNVKTLEKIVTLWKNHCTWIEGEPVNAMTTKEIRAYFLNTDLDGVLMAIDMIIYAGTQTSGQVNFGVLLKVLEERFDHKKEKLIKKKERKVKK